VTAKSRCVTVRLTLAEAGAIEETSDNGVDQGYFYINDDGTDTGHGGRRRFVAWERGIAKLRDAIRDAGGLDQKSTPRRGRRAAVGGSPLDAICPCGEHGVDRGTWDCETLVVRDVAEGTEEGVSAEAFRADNIEDEETIEALARVLRRETRVEMLGGGATPCVEIRLAGGAS